MSITDNVLRSRKFWLFVLLGLGCLVRILYFTGATVIDAEAMGRLFATLQWVENPTLIPAYGVIFGPLYFYLFACIAKISALFGFLVSDAVIIANIMFSIITAYFFYKTIEILSEYKCALLSLAIFLFWPLFVEYSVVPTAEILFLLFSWAALFCFVGAVKYKNIPYLAFSGIAISLAFLCRFEAVVLGAVFLLFVLFNKKFKKHIYWYAPLLFVGVVFWGSVCYFSTGNFLAFFDAGSQTVEKVVFVPALYGWMGVLFKVFPIGIAVLGFLGLLKSASLKKNYLLAVVFISMIFMLIVKGVSVLEYRYILFAGSVFVFFAAFFMDFALKNKPKFFGAVFGCVLVIMFSFGYTHFFGYKKRHTPADGFLPLLEFLKENVALEETILLEDVAGIDQALSVYSEIDVNNIFFVPMIYRSKQFFLDKERIVKLLKEKAPNWFVYIDIENQSLMGKNYDFAQTAFLDGIVYTRMFEKGIFAVYKAKK